MRVCWTKHTKHRERAFCHPESKGISPRTSWRVSHFEMLFEIRNELLSQKVGISYFHENLASLKQHKHHFSNNFHKIRFQQQQKFGKELNCSLSSISFRKPDSTLSPWHPTFFQHQKKCRSWERSAAAVITK